MIIGKKILIFTGPDSLETDDEINVACDAVEDAVSGLETAFSLPDGIKVEVKDEDEV